MPYLIDTDVLVDYLRKKPGAADYLESVAKWSYSIVTEMELIAGARNREEVSVIRHLLLAYRKVPLTEERAQLACNLVAEFATSHGLDPLDALIAASAISESLTLASRNRKHFESIGGLEVEVPDYGP